MERVTFQKPTRIEFLPDKEEREAVRLASQIFMMIQDKPEPVVERSRYWVKKWLSEHKQGISGHIHANQNT